jgi:hypothetical protein
MKFHLRRIYRRIFWSRRKRAEHFSKALDAALREWYWPAHIDELFTDGPLMRHLKEEK